MTDMEGWISVKDRSPEMTQVDSWEKNQRFSDRVIVIEQGRVYFGRYWIPYGTWSVEGRNGNIQVSHWFPLPEPPKQ